LQIKDKFFNVLVFTGKTLNIEAEKNWFVCVFEIINKILWIEVFGVNCNF